MKRFTIEGLDLPEEEEELAKSIACSPEMGAFVDWVVVKVDNAVLAGQGAVWIRVFGAILDNMGKMLLDAAADMAKTGDAGRAGTEPADFDFDDDDPLSID